jgi:hypothetical protein
MKTLTPALLNFLQNNNSFNKADLFQITLNNGQIIYASDYGVDLTFGGNIYYATQYGVWKRGPVTQEAKARPESTTMDITLEAKQSVLYPGTDTSLMATLNAGLFDGAIVKVLTVYWPIGTMPPRS